MTIDELVPLTNGLSVTACGQTLVCDRTRIVPVKNSDVFDLKFLIAGTDHVPRVRLTRERVLNSSAADVTRIVRGVVRALACTH
jgi:hypothetical protein